LWHHDQQRQNPGRQGHIPTGHASPPAQEKDTLGEQFNKFAECQSSFLLQSRLFFHTIYAAGKKALGSLFTKVKAKFNEFEQSQ
jgi:hypothetical protein